MHMSTPCQLIPGRHNQDSVLIDCSSTIVSAFQAALKASVGYPQFDLRYLGSSSFCIFSACKTEVLLTMIIWKDTSLVLEFLKEVSVLRVQTRRNKL